MSEPFVAFISKNNLLNPFKRYGVCSFFCGVDHPQFNDSKLEFRFHRAQVAVNTANGCDHEDALVGFAPPSTWDLRGCGDLILANRSGVGDPWAQSC